MHRRPERSEDNSEGECCDHACMGITEPKSWGKAIQHDERMQHDGEKLHGERNRHVGRNTAFTLSRS